ncbi:glycosyltransferase family 2 protein [Marivirga sp.]|uniref:glycosyltransferase family 2 protein n=1 Tax=Marivirga sp. TaxID=2018662 RepID=UPI002D80208D|nr:glycosyltransferase [Marivirga sp.]HET8859608.1 glycosyltransferase [Marivirga sp.]
MYQEISQFFNYSIFFYATSIMLFYLVLAVISLFAMRDYIKQTTHVYFDDILRSPLAPKISIIAPAYNEELSIVDNIRSLLNLQYNNYDIIIVNDGSKDDSLKKMIEAYDLEVLHGLQCVDLPHQEVRNVYRSVNPAFKKLTVIDKKNGGKSDALNAGISYSDAELVACIDVDCVIEDDALLKLVKPYLEETQKRVIAVGGVVRIANDCKIEDGRLIKVKLAKNQLARFQTLEYIRAFLLGRMAWGHLNGLLIISGAFGMFDRKLLIEVGGYDTSTVGEDMELVVRMRRRMAEQNIAYKVAYVPDPLCWTEVPESTSSFMKQRNRWTRGTIETLRSHKKILFRKKYGLMGMLSYPFWFLYEWLAPIIEFLGTIYFLVMVSLGWINWSHFYILVALIYSYAILISFLALWIEEISYREYSSGKALLSLMFTAILEPIFYHPLTVWAAIKGNYDQFVLKKKSWGDQQRKGFKK